MYLILGLIYTD